VVLLCQLLNYIVKKHTHENLRVPNFGVMPWFYLDFGLNQIYVNVKSIFSDCICVNTLHIYVSPVSYNRYIGTTMHHQLTIYVINNFRDPPMKSQIARSVSGVLLYFVVNTNPSQLFDKKYY